MSGAELCRSVPIQAEERKAELRAHVEGSHHGTAHACVGFQASQTVVGPLLFPERCTVTHGCRCLSPPPGWAKLTVLTVQSEGHCSHNDTTVTVTALSE